MREQRELTPKEAEVLHRNLTRLKQSKADAEAAARRDDAMKTDYGGKPQASDQSGSQENQ